MITKTELLLNIVNTLAAKANFEKDEIKLKYILGIRDTLYGQNFNYDDVYRELQTSC